MAPKLATVIAAAAMVLVVAAAVLLVAVEGAGAEEPKLNPPVAVADAVAVEGAPNKVEGAAAVVAAPDGAAAGAAGVPKVKPILILCRYERSIVACLSPWLVSIEIMSCVGFWILILMAGSCFLGEVIVDFSGARVLFSRAWPSIYWN